MTEVIPLPLQQSLIQLLLPLFGAFIPARHHAINHDDSYFFRPSRKNFTLIAPQPSLRKIRNCQMCGPSRIIHPAFARIFPRFPPLSNVRILKFHFQQSRMSAGIGFEAVENHSFSNSLSIGTMLSIEFATPCHALRAQFGVVCIQTEMHGPGHLLLTLCVNSPCAPDFYEAVALYP